jgi:hypothetical protein
LSRGTVSPGVAAKIAMIWRSRSVRRTARRRASAQGALAVERERTEAICSISGGSPAWPRRRMLLMRSSSSRGSNGLARIVVGARSPARRCDRRLGARRQHQDRHIGPVRRLAARSRPLSPGIITSTMSRSKANPASRPRASAALLAVGDAEAVVAEIAREQFVRMRLSSSMTRRCGALSSAGAAWVAAVSGSQSAALHVGADQGGDLVALGGVDHAARNSAPSRSAGTAFVKRTCRAARLQKCEQSRSASVSALRSDRAGAGGGLRPRLLLDEAGVDQLLQHAAEALLGDLENVEEVGDAHAGVAVDEMETRWCARPKPSPASALVGIADEVAIGEEQELDQVECRPPSGRSRSGSDGRTDAVETFMSAILTYLASIVIERQVPAKRSSSKLGLPVTSLRCAERRAHMKKHSGHWPD